MPSCLPLAVWGCGAPDWNRFSLKKTKTTKNYSGKSAVLTWMPGGGLATSGLSIPFPEEGDLQAQGLKG